LQHRQMDYYESLAAGKPTQGRTSADSKTGAAPSAASIRQGNTQGGGFGATHASCTSSSTRAHGCGAREAARKALQVKYPTNHKPSASSRPSRSQTPQAHCPFIAATRP
jgi:hypothetical protein